MEPASGTIAAGDSLDLWVRFDATDLDDGDHEGVVVVSSNDPLTPSLRIPCRLHVGVLALKLEVRPDRLRTEREGGAATERESDGVEHQWGERGGPVRARLYLPRGVDHRRLVAGSVRLQHVLAPLVAGDEDEGHDDDASTVTVAGSMRGRQERDEERERPKSRPARFRFDRAALLALLPDAGKAQVELTGELEGISWFAAVDSVEVVAHPHGTAAEAAGARPLRALPERDGLRLLARNPVSGTVRLELTLAAPADVRVRVYDVGGALVRELTRANLEAGFHGVTWDGRTVSGASVRSGIYFVRLEGGRESVTQRIVLTR